MIFEKSTFRLLVGLGLHLGLLLAPFLALLAPKVSDSLWRFRLLVTLRPPFLTFSVLGSFGPPFWPLFGSLWAPFGPVNPYGGRLHQSVGVPKRTQKLVGTVVSPPAWLRCPNAPSCPHVLEAHLHTRRGLGAGRPKQGQLIFQWALCQPCNPLRLRASCAETAAVCGRAFALAEMAGGSPA